MQTDSIIPRFNHRTLINTPNKENKTQNRLGSNTENSLTDTMLSINRNKNKSI